MTDRLKVGDHLVSPRAFYHHHGLYAGDNLVIEYRKSDRRGIPGRVTEVPLEDFHEGSSFWVKAHGRVRYDPQTAIERARSRLGESDYGLASNNCEHFVEWCLNGDHRSAQVDQVFVAAGGAAWSVLRHAPITTGRATLGATAPGAAGAGAAGLAAGTAGGLAVGAAVNRFFFADHETLEPEEREARTTARGAAYLGGVGGTLAGITTVGRLGAVAGLAAGGAKSGVAALGAKLGGGAALGTLGVVALPFALAIGAGGLALHLAKRSRSDPIEGPSDHERLN